MQRKGEADFKLDAALNVYERDNMKTEHRILAFVNLGLTPFLHTFVFDCLCSVLSVNAL